MSVRYITSLILLIALELSPVGVSWSANQGPLDTPKNRYPVGSAKGVSGDSGNVIPEDAMKTAADFRGGFPAEPSSQNPLGCSPRSQSLVLGGQVKGANQGGLAVPTRSSSSMIAGLGQKAAKVTKAFARDSSALTTALGRLASHATEDTQSDNPDEAQPIDGPCSSYVETDKQMRDNMTNLLNEIVEFNRAVVDNANETATLFLNTGTWAGFGTNIGNSGYDKKAAKTLRKARENGLKELEKSHEVGRKQYKKNIEITERIKAALVAYAKNRNDYSVCLQKDKLANQPRAFYQLLNLLFPEAFAKIEKRKTPIVLDNFKYSIFNVTPVREGIKTLERMQANIDRDIRDLKGRRADALKRVYDNAPPAAAGSPEAKTETPAELSSSHWNDRLGQYDRLIEDKERMKRVLPITIGSYKLLLKTVEHHEMMRQMVLLFLK